MAEWKYCIECGSYYNSDCGSSSFICSECEDTHSEKTLTEGTKHELLVEVSS